MADASLPDALPPVYTPVPLQSLSAAGHIDELHEKDRKEIIELGKMLGIGASDQYPAQDGGVRRARGAGFADWGLLRTLDIGTGGVIAKRQLNYVNAATLHSGTTLTGGVWTDVNSDQSFTVDDANSVVAISVTGNLLMTHNTTLEAGTAILVDGTTRYLLGGGYSNVNNQFACTVQGVVYVTGLSAGTHNIRVQVIANAAAVIYMRTAAGFANYEHLQMQVVEFKR